MKLTWRVCLLLFSFTPAFSMEARPTVFLSHFWIALDQTTYDAMRTSEAVAALGAVKEQRVVAGRESWSGFYWTGRQTYMEFFGSDALPEDTLVGDCGIGLSVEAPGGVAAVAERLRTVFADKIKIDRQLKTTAIGNIPWYTLTYVDLKALQNTAMWVMELDPGYLAAIHPEAPVANPLSRRQERSWDYRPDLPLENVVRLTLVLKKTKILELAPQFRLIGWPVYRDRTGLVAVGPDVTIRLVPAGAREGIKQVEFRLRRVSPEQRIQLGAAELRLSGHIGQLLLWK